MGSVPCYRPAVLCSSVTPCPLSRWHGASRAARCATPACLPQGFIWAFLSGVSEPVGGLVGYLALSGSSELSFAIVFGIVAGMMVYIRCVVAASCAALCKQAGARALLCPP